MSRSHPQREEIAAEVSSWYRDPFADLGISSVERDFGWCRRFPDGFGSVTPKPVVVDILLRGIEAEYGDGPVDVQIYDERLDGTLGAALVARGWTRDAANVHLLHDGPVPAAPRVEGMVVEPVTIGSLPTFIRVKVQGFDDSEEEPSEAALTRERALRTSELDGDATLLVARIDEEPAAILAHYSGDDRLIYLLATRVPYRGRGIATALLCGVLEQARSDGCRSTLINTDPDGKAIALYRKLGFTDPIVWRRRYTPPARA